MTFFKCRGCTAHELEIVHLMAQLDRLSGMVEKSQARVAELAEPGIAMRLAGADRVAKQAPLRERPAPRPLVPTFPGYDREVKTGPHVDLDEGGES